MKIQTFNDVEREVRNAIASKPAPTQVQVEPEVKASSIEYPKVGDRWPGPIHGAPYANPRMEAHNFYKMPGRRVYVDDIWNMVWGQKKGYYNRLFTSILFGVAAAVTLILIPLPYSVIALPLAGFAFFYWNHGWNQKFGDFEVFKKFGVIRNVLTDNETYPVYKAPFKITQKWIWK